MEKEKENLLPVSGEVVAIPAIIKTATIFEDEENGASLILTLDRQIDGIVQNEKTKEFERKLTDTIYIRRGIATVDMCDASDDIADYRATLNRGFDTQDVGIILRKAEVVLERTFWEKGSEVEWSDNPLDHMQFDTRIKSLTLSKRAIEKIDRATELRH